MKRLFSAIANDVRLQFRHGFYHVYLIISTIYIVGLKLLPVPMRMLALPVIIFSDPGMLGFYFIAALVLFEKEARSLQAVNVTPLRPGEYLLAKAISLSTLAILASTVVAVLVWGPKPQLFLLIPLVGLCGAVVVFAGFSLAARHRTFSLFLLQSFPVLFLIGLPVVDILGIYSSPLFYLFPSYPALLAIKSLFISDKPLVLAANTLLLAGWAYAFYHLALRSYDKHIVGRG